MDTTRPVRFSQRVLSWLIISLLVWQPVAPSFAAAITPTGPASMDKAANGVPVVNIATPNAAGISHNQFNDYNVGREGVILNNATGQLTQTQLGGLIQNNPNLRAGQEARGIINEVTGASRSQLQGYTEVAGKAANVMVANPYGIICNGCGFINTPNATLTTGKPQFDAAGNLSSLEVTKGTITVEGQGLDASGSDALSLISRATEVNAAIHAKDLTVTAGASRVDANGNATAIAGEGAAPVVAVDTGALGGMYANRIHLVSSEKGVGVNLGNLTARQGDITLDASGRMTVKNSLASGSLTAKADNVILSGSHKAGGNIALTSAQDMALNNATLAADGKLTLSGSGHTQLNASSLTSGGDMALGGKQLTSDAATRVNAAGSATLTAQTLTHQGQLIAGGDARISAGRLDNRGALAAKGSLTATTTSLASSGTLQGQTLAVRGETVQNSGTLAADNALRVEAGALTTGADSVITGKGDVTLTAQTTADLNGRVNAGRALSVNAADLQTRQNAQMQSASGMTLAADTATLNGTQAAKGALSVTAKMLNHGGKSNAAAITLSAPDSITNSGTLVADSLNLRGTHLTNSGLLQGTRALGLQTDWLDNLTGGTLYSARDLTLAIPELNNSGLITTDGDLYLRGDALVNGGEINGVNVFSDYGSLTSSGRLLADDALSLTASAINTSGVLAAKTAGINADTLNNQGNIQGNEYLTLAVQNTTNSGDLRSAGTLNLSGQTLDNSGSLSASTLLLTLARQAENRAAGRIFADDGLVLNAPVLLNSGLVAANNLDLAIANITSSGTLQGTGALTVTGKRLNNQQGGLLLSNGAITLQNDALTNAGQIQGGTLDLATGEWINTGNALGEKGLNATVQGQLDNQGKVVSQQGLTVQAGATDNSGALMAKVLALHGDLKNSGLIQGADQLAWDGVTLTGTAGGELISGGSLALQGRALDNDGRMQGRTLTATADSWRNGGTVQAQDSLNATLSDRFDNQGQFLSQARAQISAAQLINDGKLAAKDLIIDAPVITSNGILQGNDSLTLTTQTLFNGRNGQLVSGGALALNLDSLENQGLLYVDDGLTLSARQLINGGSLEAGALDLTLNDTLTNSGTLLAHDTATLRTDQLTNSGQMAADSLSLTGKTLTNNGLWQGTHGLTLSADTLTTGAGSRTLSGGDFTVTAGQLTTQGTLQGGQVSVTADDWTLGGTLLSQGSLDAGVAGTLTLPGSLTSQGAMNIRAQTLNNDGQLLSAGDITLRGQQLMNNGTVQGKTLAAHQARITNNGTLTGLESLTLDNRQATMNLMARMAMATPQLELINGTKGSLLTQGTLDITAGAVTNAGGWQGNNILLAAQSLDNSGAVQSAGALSLELAGNLTATAGSKITAMGTAALKALALTNDGQWAAKNLTLNAESLTNRGAISGSDGLTATLTGSFTQQAGATLASNGELNLSAATASNQGNIQGGDVTLTAASLTNGTGAELVSARGLTLTAPSLFNYGLIQGAGETRIDATAQALNAGRLLSGARLTLTTPQYGGTGWLQATNLILNAANNAGSGTLLADQMILTGDTFTHQGTTQANNLTLNYRQLTNNGTLLGNSQLTVNATQVDQSASGKLFSGGDLFVGANGLNALGQLVALGNLTLKLVDAFTGKTALAAGKTLSISSNGAMDNRSVMQGQAVNLSAGGQLTNSGQITTGSGASTLSGSSIVLSGNSSLQGGGDMTLASRGNITTNGFAGTLGSLTLSAPGAIINTALLYAANNLALYANSITNQRGDMLAGNNLWLQRDAAGNANTEVANTSGTIETRNGDITIKTGHLLNQRDGLKANTVTTTAQTIPGVGNPTLSVHYSLLPTGSYGYYRVDNYEESPSCGGKDGGCSSWTVNTYHYAPFEEYATQKFVLSETRTDVTSNGGSARIASGRNASISANILDNRASEILSGNNLTLQGSQLNNQSWQNGTTADVLVYKYGTGNTVKYAQEALPEGGFNNKNTKYSKYVQDIVFTLQGHEKETTQGQIYRSVIQAGGNVSANFSSNISNTNTIANAGGVSGTITAPSLNTLSNQGIGGSVVKQALANAPVAVNSPQWQDQLQNALQQINGGGSLDNGSTSGAALSQISGQQKGNASLGNAGSLANAGVTSALLKNTDNGALSQYQGKSVDTSAYPLPSGNNGYFVVSDNPKSPYLITVNPKLDGLGQLDPALFGDLNKLLGLSPAAAPRETSAKYTDEKQFLGSSYMLERIKLNPDYDYRFLGDAAFDTRYVSNALLNQTGNRYLNGVGSDLAQMQYLMDNAANAQQSLGLQFGVSLTADQIAALDHSILWWESATINGETVLIPKLYLSPKDVTVNNGSVIAGNNVSLEGGNVTNSGSTLLARNDLSVNSSGQITNSNDALLKAGGNVDLSAVGDISNISSTISGKTVALESLDGSISNITLADQYSLDAKGKYGSVSLKDTTLGSIADITALDGLSLTAAKDITLAGSTLKAGGDLLMDAGGNIAVNAIQNNDAYSQSGFARKTATSNASVAYQGSAITAGGNLAMLAGNDLTLSASDVSADKNAQLSAGNDLNLNAQQTSQNSRNGNSESHSTGLDRTTVSAGNNLTLTAGQDINSQAAGLAAKERVAMQAGRDINLLAEDMSQGNSARAKKQTIIKEQVRQQGTEITSGTDTVMVAGRDVYGEAAQVLAKGDVGVSAGRDLILTSATESDYDYFEKIKTKKGFLKKKTTHTIQENSQTDEKGTLLSGDNVSLNAGNNLLVTGSAIAAEGDIALKAANDVTVEAATEESSHYSMKKTKKSGVFGGGLGLTVGSQTTQASRKGSEVAQSDARSVIGTTGGNVIISAGNQATLSAADVVAGRAQDDTERKTGHIDITASDIAIIPGRDIVQETVKQSSKSSGLGISLSNPIIDAVQNVRDIIRMGGSGITQGKTLAGEAAATFADLGNGTSLPISYGRSSAKSESNYYAEFSTGSNLTAAGNIQLDATGSKTPGDVLISGSRLGAGEAVIIDAKNSVDITTSTDKEILSTRNSSSSWNITSAMPTIGSAIRTVSGGPNHGAGILPFGIDNSASKGDRQTTAQTGSQISGTDIYITSQNGQVNLSGSALAAINDLLLSAKNGDINVTTGNNSVYDKQSGKETFVGSLGGDGYSGKVGYSSSNHASMLDRDQQSTLRSQISSQQGNVALQAKNDVSVNGGDISAGKSLVLSGENVRLDVSEDRLHTRSDSSSSQYAATAYASGWAVTAAQALESAARSQEEGRDPRLTAIYAAQAGLTTAANVAQEAYNSSMIRVGVGVSAGSSKEKQDYRNQQQQGSTLAAGESVILKASQDIEGQGVNIAGKNVVLSAGRDISLSAALDTEQQKNSSSGNQYSLGVSFSLIGQQNGFSVDVGASRSQGKENGSSLVNHNSQVHADETLNVSSGRDTTLQGAELRGDRVVADVGRNLTISSQQDNAKFDSKNSSSGVNISICVPPICAGSSVQGSANVSSGKLNNNYRSVIDQSGIFAGAGGFDISVGNHTQLDGAVIASDAEAAKNRLSTDTLGWSDIRNKAESGGSQFGLNVSGGVAQNSQSGGYQATTGETAKDGQSGGYKGTPGGLPSASLAHVSESASSTTHSAVAAGDIIIRDPAKQQQDVAELSRNTANAHQALENNFDRQKIQDSLEIQQQATALGTQAMTVYMDSKLDAAKQQVRDDMAARGELNGLSETEIDKKVTASPEFKAADKEYGIGSPFWTTSSAMTGLLAGVLGGNVQGGMAAGAAPVLAKLVKDAAGENEAARIALHTVVSAALAKAQGGNVTAGAIGGLIASAGAERFAEALYGKKADELTPDEKMVVLNLVAAVSAAGGGVATGNTAGMVSAGNAARVEVENNSLSTNQLSGFAERARTCQGASCETVIKDMIALNAEQQVDIAELCTTNPKQCHEKYGYLVEQWPAFDAMIKHMAADGSLPDDFRDALTPIYAQSLEAEGIMASPGWTERFEAMGANKEIAQAMAATLPMLISGAKGAKGSKNTTVGKSGSSTIVDIAKGTVANSANTSLKIGETKIINEVSVTRVGRWMSPDELAQMQRSGKVVQGGGGQTFISTNGASDYKGAASTGSVYVEFDVSTNSLLKGGKDGWFKLIGPDASKSQQFMLNKQGGTQLPEVKNISIIDKK